MIGRLSSFLVQMSGGELMHPFSEPIPACRATSSLNEAQRRADMVEPSVVEEAEDSGRRAQNSCGLFQFRIFKLIEFGVTGSVWMFYGVKIKKHFFYSQCQTKTTLTS